MKVWTQLNFTNPGGFFQIPTKEKLKANKLKVKRKKNVHVTPQPGKVDTWQPPRIFEWVPVFRNSFKGPQDIWYSSPFEKQKLTQLMMYPKPTKIF